MQSALYREYFVKYSLRTKKVVKSSTWGSTMVGVHAVTDVQKKMGRTPCPGQRGETRQGAGAVRWKPSAGVRLHSRGPELALAVRFQTQREKWKK